MSQECEGICHGWLDRSNCTTYRYRKITRGYSNGDRDNWQVLGRSLVVEDRLKTQRTWLWGEKSGRAALELSFAAGMQRLETKFLPVSWQEAEIIFSARLPVTIGFYCYREKQIRFSAPQGFLKYY